MLPRVDQGIQLDISSWVKWEAKALAGFSALTCLHWLTREEPSDYCSSGGSVKGHMPRVPYEKAQNISLQSCTTYTVVALSCRRDGHYDDLSSKWRVSICHCQALLKTAGYFYNTPVTGQSTFISTAVEFLHIKQQFFHQRLILTDPCDT